MILVLLPAFNEEMSLPFLIPALKEAMNDQQEDYQILVCDDGSTDNTLSLLDNYAQELPLKVINHPINRGLGETSRDLFEAASRIVNPGDVIIRMDCDATHEPMYIYDIIKKIREGYDVVIASRFSSGGHQLGVSNYRAFISRAANLFMKVFFPIKGLKEYSCGFRGYRAEIVHEAISFYGNDFIQLKGLGFTCTLEKVVKLKLIGARFAEVPFVLRYDQKQSGSKMVSSVTTLGYLIMTLLYHWPWGGWRTGVKKRHRTWLKNNENN